MAKQITFNDLFSDGEVHALDTFGVHYNPDVVFSDRAAANAYYFRTMSDLEDAMDCNDREDYGLN